MTKEDYSSVEYPLVPLEVQKDKSDTFREEDRKTGKQFESVLEAAVRGCGVDHRTRGRPCSVPRINGEGRTLRGDDDMERKTCGGPTQ